MEGVIQQPPSKENQFCHVVKFLSGEKKEKELPVHLDGMNSGVRVTNMTSSAYEEEVSKIKAVLIMIILYINIHIICISFLKLIQTIRLIVDSLW